MCLYRSVCVCSCVKVCAFVNVCACMRACICTRSKHATIKFDAGAELWTSTPTFTLCAWYEGKVSGILCSPCLAFMPAWVPRTARRLYCSQYYLRRVGHYMHRIFGEFLQNRRTIHTPCIYTWFWPTLCFSIAPAECCTPAGPFWEAWTT